MVVSVKGSWVVGGTLALVASVSTFLGCSAEHGGPADEQGVGVEDADSPTIQGDLLARVELTKTHYVEFRALPDGAAGVGILEFGNMGEKPLDRAEWDALGPEGVYKSLAKREAPEALLAASRTMREKQFRLSDLNTVQDIELKRKPASVSTKTGVGDLKSAVGEPKSAKLTLSLPVDRSKTITPRLNSTLPVRASSSRTGDGLGKSTQAVYGDAAWWSANFCGSSLNFDPDTIWCPTNAGSVTGGTRYTMYYEAAGMSAPGGQGATFKVESYNWSTGAWNTSHSIALAAGQWASYGWQGEVTFRASVKGVNNSAVHFVDKYRRQATYLTHYTYFPSDIGWDFGNDIQGVATDGAAWYMTRTQANAFGNYGEIAKIPIGTSLNSEPTNVQSQPGAWENGYNHYGSLTHRSGRLYVALEGSSGCAIGVYSSTLSALALKTVATPAGGANNKCAWVAHNPRDGLFYGGLEGRGDEKLFKYSIGASSPFTLTHQGHVTASTAVSHIQGGSFSPRGVLWIFAGYKSAQLNLYAIDVRNGFVYHRASYSGGSDWEAEGISVFDLTDGRAPNISGHIHAQLLRNDTLSDDNWWFAHLVANDPAAL